MTLYLVAPSGAVDYSLPFDSYSDLLDFLEEHPERSSADVVDTGDWE